jgi:hypothetical protein
MTIGDEMSEPGLTKEEALMVDHQKARDYIDKYKTAVTHGFIARVAILTGAIQDFNSFRDLPPSSDLALAIWDLAFGIVSAVVPALKLGDFFKQQQERAEVALKAAEAFGQKARRADKVVHVVSKKVQQGGTAAKYANEVKGILDKAKAVEKYKGEVEQHASRGPIQELVKDLYEAPKAWETVINLETQEWENRLADLKTTGTLLEIVQNKLTLPPELDEEEIRLMYLFEMILAHYKKEAYWDVQYWGSKYSAPKEIRRRLVGLNDNQKRQIVDWFGPGTKRGPHFKRPHIFNIGMFYGLFPVPEKIRLVAA